MVAWATTLTDKGERHEAVGPPGNRTPPLVLQNVMGHSTIVTTQRFYIAPDAERDATRALADLSRAVAGSNGDAAGGKQVASAGHGNADDPSEKEG